MPSFRILDLLLRRPLEPILLCEFWLAPDLRRRIDSEFPRVKLFDFHILRVKFFRFLIERHQLWCMIEISSQHLLAKFPVPASEQRMFVPYYVDYLRWRHVIVTNDAKVDELLVFAYSEECEVRAPAMLLCDLRRERTSEGVFTVEHCGHFLCERG